jgi:hypothetical protein
MIKAYSGWAILVAGLASILVLQLVRVDIVYTYWGWGKSFFAQRYFWPLLKLAFGVCVVGPLLLPRTFRQRLLFSLLGGLAACTLYFGSSLVTLLLYGT